MAQERFWNWLDDDSTFRLNWRDLVIIPYGVYAGFDKERGSGMTLILSHSADNKTKVKQDLKETSPLGIWKTKQGVVVVEDAPVTLSVSTGHPSVPRIDLVVGEHFYTEAEGGSVAVYKIIQGIPSSNPVAPNLTEPNKQVIIGQLHIPARTSNLDNATWVKAQKPNVFSDDTIMHTDRVQSVSALKVFSATRGELVATSAVGNLINTDILSNLYFVSVPQGSKYYEINSISRHFSGSGHTSWFIADRPLKLTPANHFYLPDGDVYIEAGQVFGLLHLNGVGGISNKYAVISGANAVNRTQKVNKLNGLLAQNMVVGQIDDYGNLPLTQLGANMVRIDGDAILQSIDSLKLSKYVPEAPTEGGTIIYVWFNPASLAVIMHQNPSRVQGSIPIETPTGKDVDIKGSSIAMFIEVGGAWALCTIFSSEYTTLMKRSFRLEDLTNVDYAPVSRKEDYAEEGTIPLANGKGVWEATPLKREIEGYDLDFRHTIALQTSVFRSSRLDQLPLHEIGEGRYELERFGESTAKRFALQLNRTMGNIFVFDFPLITYPTNTRGESMPMVISGMTKSVRMGTIIELIFTGESYIFEMESDNLGGDLLPFKSQWTELKASNRKPLVQFNRGETLRFIRLSDYWWIQNTPTLQDADAPDTYTNNSAKLNMPMLNIKRTRDNIILQQENKTISSVDGLGMHIEVAEVICSNGVRLNQHHGIGYGIHRPPNGYKITDLIACFASIKYGNFAGDVNADDYIICETEVLTNLGYIKVKAGFSEQSQIPKANLLCFWRK